MSVDLFNEFVAIASSWVPFGLVNFVFTKLRIGNRSFPGAPEILAKGGGLRPPPFARVRPAPGATQTPKTADFQSLNESRIC